MFEVRHNGYAVLLSCQAAGTARPSFLTMQLEELQRHGEDKKDNVEQLKVAAMHMYGGESIILANGLS